MSRGSSKRKPNLTQEELREIAEQNGVIDEYDAVLSILRPRFEGMRTTRSGVNLLGTFEGSRGTVVNLIPGESSEAGGIHVQVYARRFAEHAGVPIEMITSALPDGMSPWTLDPNGDDYWRGVAGFLRPEDARRLVEQVFVGAVGYMQTALPAVEPLAR